MVVIAICCLIIIAALVLGVGLATNLVLRHVVQTIPLWVGVILGFRRSPVAGWVALAPFGLVCVDGPDLVVFTRHFTCTQRPFFSD
jgi:hypothetical protein